MRNSSESESTAKIALGAMQQSNISFKPNNNVHQLNHNATNKNNDYTASNNH